MIIPSKGKNDIVLPGNEDLYSHWKTGGQVKEARNVILGLLGHEKTHP